MNSKQHVQQLVEVEHKPELVQIQLQQTEVRHVLALRLKHDLGGRLTATQQKRFLDKLLEVAAKGGG